MAVAPLLLLGLAACTGPETAAPPPSPSAEAPTQEESATPTPTSSATPEPSASAAPATASEPAPEDAEGRWCSAEEGDDSAGACFVIELPEATYDDGTEVDITAHGSPWAHGDGAFEFAAAEGPFGTYYPAGAPLEGYDGHLGPDPVEQDRIWNPQTGTLHLRAES